MIISSETGIQLKKNDSSPLVGEEIASPVNLPDLFRQGRGYDHE
jgi:hypothetical protein